MTNTYTLNSPKLAESLEVSYTDGIIDQVKFPVKSPLSLVQYNALIQNLPYNEDLLPFKSESLNLTATKKVGSNVKLGMFCSAFMEKYPTMKYKASGKDANMLKPYDINPEILKHYFYSENFLFKGKHSVSNLVRYWNELLIEYQGSGRSEFPDYYSKEVDSKLSTENHLKYNAHLRKLGLVAKKDKVGNVIDWVKQNVNR